MNDDSNGAAPQPCTMSVVGRVKSSQGTDNVDLAEIFKLRFEGGGHPQAASGTVKLSGFGDAKGVMDDIVDDLIRESDFGEVRVCDFMTSPVLTISEDMVEREVAMVFKRSSVRALPVVDKEGALVGMVTYKEISAAQLRLQNKMNKHPDGEDKGTKVKAWMLERVSVVGMDDTLEEAEKILLESDIGNLPVVDGEKRRVVGMITRTDLLRQHQYYDGLHYNNKAFADKIADRKPMIELRKKLKMYDPEL